METKGGIVSGGAPYLSGFGRLCRWWLQPALILKFLG
jgi:hypothetical protein